MLSSREVSVTIESKPCGTIQVRGKLFRLADVMRAASVFSEMQWPANVKVEETLFLNSVESIEHTTFLYSFLVQPQAESPLFAPFVSLIRCFLHSLSALPLDSEETTASAIYIPQVENLDEAQFYMVLNTKRDRVLWLCDPARVCHESKLSILSLVATMMLSEVLNFSKQ